MAEVMKRRRPALPLASALAAALALFAVAPSAAEAQRPARADHDGEHAHNRFGILLVGEAEPGHAEETAVGLGIEYEVRLAPHFELAIEVGWLDGEAGWRVPLELLGEVLLLDRPRGDVYVGVGPSVVPRRHEIEAGFATAVGTHFRIRERQMQLELRYQHLVADQVQHHVLGASVGVSFSV